MSADSPRDLQETAAWLAEAHGNAAMRAEHGQAFLEGFACAAGWVERFAEAAKAESGQQQAPA